MIRTQYRNKKIDFKDEGGKYRGYVKTRLNTGNLKIIPYKNHLLPEIATRAIARKKPCGKDGQGFRDALIWLTVKEYAHEKKAPIIFISGDGGDFIDVSDDDLHEELRNECIKEKLNIIFYSSLSNFIKEHSKTVGLITSDWLNKNVDWTKFTSFVIDNLTTWDSRIREIIKRRFP